MSDKGLAYWLSNQGRQQIRQDVNQWVDRNLRYYGGPHLYGALVGSPADSANKQPARGGLLPALGEMTPAADVRDMYSGSRELAQALANKDVSGAVSGGSLLAAAMLGTMVPGSASGYRQAAEEATEGARKGIRAYHGSPHDFDQFSMSRIGTGEGATAFGHGLYFAENEKVAKAYREALSPGRGADVRDTAARILDSVGGDYDRALKSINARIEAYNKTDPQFRVQDGGARLQAVKQMIADKMPLSGRMYEVNIKAPAEDFIDFDAPVGRQSPKAQEAIRKVYGDIRNPDATYLQAPDATTAQALKEAGVPGLKYLDQASRGAEEGTRNFVVFDDSLIEIMRKYGILAPVAGGAAALSMQPSESQAKEARQ